MRKRLLTAALTAALAAGATLGLAGTAQASVTQDGMSLYSIYLSKGGGVTEYDPADREAAEFGDAVLMESNGEYLLMDTGQGWCSNDLVNYLRKVGVERLSIYVSHVHPDHMDGVEAIANATKLNEDGAPVPEFQIERLYYPDAKYGKDWAPKEGATVQTRIDKLTGWVRNTNPNCIMIPLSVGDTLQVGAVTGNVLGPVNTKTPGYYDATTCGPDKATSARAWTYGGDTTLDRRMGHYINNYSLTTMFTAQGANGKTTKFLTCGDIEYTEELALVAKYGSQLRADILKLNHHGIDTSNSEKFIDAVKPQWTICENMAFNKANYASKSSDGETRKANPMINALKRVQKYGFVYTVGVDPNKNVWHSFGMKVDGNGGVTLYKDSNENGQWSDSERLKGWTKVMGINSTSGGNRTAADSYYLVNSKPKTGVQKIGSYRYYLGTGGAREHGFYSTKSGHAWNGWQVYNSTGTKQRTSGKKYYRYFTSTGRMAVGPYKSKLKDVTGKYHRFYFKSNGIRYSSSAKWAVVKYGSYKYAVNANGVLWSDAETYWKKNKGMVKIGSHVYKTNKYGRIIKKVK
ncbi:MAG: hypothetical protein Q4D06_04780 [Coriobacteriia bacterium]|nr:hypothetical protein [Coriobacteriia bacterium]